MVGWLCMEKQPADNPRILSWNEEEDQGFFVEFYQLLSNGVLLSRTQLQGAMETASSIIRPRR